MRSTLIASIPALVVFFGLAFGFVTFHLIAQNAEATVPSAITLNIIVDRKENTQRRCVQGNNAERCRNAQNDALQVCSEYYSRCR